MYFKSATNEQWKYWHQISAAATKQMSCQRGEEGDIYGEEKRRLINFNNDQDYTCREKDNSRGWKKESIEVANMEGQEVDQKE